MPPEDLEKKEDLTPGSDEGKTPEPSQDPVKDELEKEQRRGGKSEAEKAAFSLKKNAERLKELGGDPSAVLGIKSTSADEDDNAPMTRGEFKKIESERAQRTALQLAEDIADPNERELTKQYLQTRVVPSGDANADFRFALAAVHSVKNGQIAEEVARKQAGSHSTSGGAPSKTPTGEFVPTEEEARFMASFKLSKEQIIAARKANETQ